MNDILQVGAVTSTHGLVGEVKVFPTTDDVKRFKKLKHVLLDTGKELLPLEIVQVKFFKQMVILKFKGYDKIEDVMGFKGKNLFVTRENAVKLKKNEYFIADLIGMKVYTEDEAYLGVLNDVLATGANDVYEVTDGKWKGCPDPCDPPVHFGCGCGKRCYESTSAGGTAGMNYYVMTLFPEMIEQGMNTSIIGRAMAKGLLTLTTLNIREYSVRGDGRIDDYPYGGGAGMVMQAEPVCRTYESLSEQLGYRPRLIYLTPQGRVFNQQMAKEFAQEKDLVFLCGHYEGIDERVLEEIATDFVSIGDYVLTGGELPSMVMMDSISRMVPGVLSNQESGETESFAGNLLEYPQYSRPEVWRGKAVPPVLLSGHHGNVDRWRRDQSLYRTLKSRPDLMEDVVLDKKDRKFLQMVTDQPEMEGEYPITEEEARFLRKLLAIQKKT